MSQCIRKLDSEPMQQLYHVTGPTYRDSGRSDGILDHEVPSDDPCQQLAHGGVGIGISAPRTRDHGGKLAVAHARKGATDSRHYERDHHRRARMIGRGDPGERKQTSADDGADAQSNQVERSQSSLEMNLSGFGFRDDLVQRFLLK